MSNSDEVHRKTAIDSAASRLSIACLSHLIWDRSLFQRPQQVMSRLARKHSIEYFCQIPTRTFWSLPRTSILTHQFSPTENVRVSYLPFLPMTNKMSLFRRLNRRLYVRKVASIVRNVAERPFVLWMYHPKDLEIINLIDTDLVVYDCMDEFQAFMNSEPETRDMERRMLESADVVFAGGRSLYEAKRPFNENTTLFPCGVEFEHFAKATADDTDLADAINDIPRPIIGYVGAVDERLDYRLLEESAKDNPDWSFVLIGPLLKVNPETLFGMPNVFYLGARPYSELPSYLKAFDVAMMPFAITELTLKISPTKTLEYMSAALPVVSSHVPDVQADYAGL
ncbi:MAG: glycosyltransferase, partial [Candidatus Coatesbacteria bacterium]|nr:glycosyltransferase [Candidatus Coatesbacteria bacterium]